MSKDTVKTPKDFPLKYNYETGKNKKLRKRQASGVCLKQKLWESVQYVQEFIFAMQIQLSIFSWILEQEWDHFF